MNHPVEIETVVQAPEDLVWEAWVSPEDIQRWNAASDDWHTPAARNDLRVGGKFVYRMEAKDGSAGFDFEGEYLEIVEKKLIRYRMSDGRDVTVRFARVDGAIQVSEAFVAEDIHSREMQRNGWQAILNRFKEHVETKAARKANES